MNGQRIVSCIGRASALQPAAIQPATRSRGAEMHLLAESGVQAVTEHDRASIIATLERASARLEASMADQRENETAGNAVSKSRKLVREAIDHLRSIAGDATSVQKVDGLPAPDAASPIDLPEIIEAIRNDELAHQEPSPPPETKRASQKPSTPGDAKAEPLAAAIDERATDTASAEPVAVKPVRPNAQGLRVPIVTASSPVSTDATERMRRLEEEKLRLVERLGSAGELPGDADETAVTFVIRGDAQATPPTAAPPTPRRSSPLLRRTQLVGAPEAAKAEAYVASWGSTEEAEVVVVRPVVQSRYGQVARSEAGPVRRLLKALRGG